jgi:hypothetical protein
MGSMVDTDLPEHGPIDGTDRRNGEPTTEVGGT